MTKKTPSSEESELFRKTIGAVTKIKQDKVLLHKKKPKPRPKTVDKEEPALPLDWHSGPVEKLSHEDRSDFLVPGMQKNVLKKLRKGYYGLDAHIDLHGLTSSQARQQLFSFLQRCLLNGDRCVHIIHGKGYRSDENYPVLKNDVNSWLRQHQDVLAFCSAPPKEGGTGALFVLLRLADKYREENDAKY